MLDRTQRFQFPRGQQGLIKEIPKLFGPLESLSELLPHSKKVTAQGFALCRWLSFWALNVSLSLYFLFNYIPTVSITINKYILTVSYARLQT